MLQNLSGLKYEWNDELKEADIREWREWFKESELLDTAQIPRALFSWNEPFRETNLHVSETQPKMLTERVRTLDENLKIM